MKLYRFTFIHGDYDVGQAVVAADSLRSRSMMKSRLRTGLTDENHRGLG